MKVMCDGESPQKWTVDTDLYAVDPALSAAADVSGHERMTRNAFRVLGLPGNAKLEAIQQAGESLLAALHNAGAPAPSAWDLPWLGPIVRTADEIEAALARLNDPTQRLYSRLFWFTQQSDILTQMTPATMMEVADSWAASTDVVLQHHAALLYLIRAQIVDAAFQTDTAWPEALALWKRVAATDSFWSMFTMHELVGDFPNPATLNMIAMVRHQACALVAQGVTAAATRALVEWGEEAFLRGRAISAMLGLPAVAPVVDEATATAFPPEVEVTVPRAADDPPPESQNDRSAVMLLPEGGIAVGELFARLGNAVKILDDVKALLPQDPRLLEPLQESQGKLQEMVVSNLERLCSEIVLACVRADHQDPQASERMMQRYETEVVPQLQRVLTFVQSDHAFLQRAWTASAFCLFCLVTVLPWEDAQTRAAVLLESAREHFLAGSPMLLRIERALVMPDAGVPLPLQAQASPAAASARADALVRGSERWRGLRTKWLMAILLLVAGCAYLGTYWRTAVTSLPALYAQIMQVDAQILQASVERDALDETALRLDEELQTLRVVLTGSEEDQRADAPAHRASLHQYNRLILERNQLSQRQQQLADEEQSLVNTYNRLATRYNAVSARGQAHSAGRAPRLELKPLTGQNR